MWASSNNLCSVADSGVGPGPGLGDAKREGLGGAEEPHCSYANVCVLQ